MMRHISMYRLKAEHRTPEIVEKLVAALNALPAKVPTITASEIGSKPYEMPVSSPDGLVDFYDIVQIITFASPEDCMGYPLTDGHNEFVALSHDYIETAVGIDYPVYD